MNVSPVVGQRGDRLQAVSHTSVFRLMETI